MVWLACLVSFIPGDVVNVLESSDEKWWYGYSTQNPHVRGLFPASFVELITMEQGAAHGQQPIADASRGVDTSEPDRESVRKTLWQLGVDQDTLEQVCRWHKALP